MGIKLSVFKNLFVQNVVGQKSPRKNQNLIRILSNVDSYSLYTSAHFSKPKIIFDIGHFQGKSTAVNCRVIRDCNSIFEFKSYESPIRNKMKFVRIDLESNKILQILISHVKTRHLKVWAKQ